MSAKGATMTAKTQSEDALKNRDLSQKKQLSFEAQRISKVLENCISQIEIVAALPAIFHLNSASSVVDEELSRALHRHQLLDERLQTLEGLKQESEGENGEARERARAQLETDIKNSVRDLLRFFRAHPDAIFGLRRRGMEVGESECKLIRGLKMFHSLMVVKLLTSLEEELQLVLRKPECPSPAHNMEHMVLVEEEVATAKKEIDSKISQRKVKIEIMQHSLQGINTLEADMSAKQHQPLIKISKKQASMKQEIDQLNIQLNNLILENRQAERVLQEKYEKVETEIEYLLQKFDNEMEENSADLKLNEIDYEREEEELRRLEKPFSVLEEECKQIQEKRRLAEEKRQQEMRELELKTKAAVFAQAWWRGYSTRKALKNKSKSTKAKKGKGKKK
ncbi:IQ domain-containing protein D [Seriola dumerili]|uniref:Dynein regulatory complex protein 10 n=1 Tax=Seriola dumerili TaxID=41447 RepID=A0A3B4UJV9_SERDU|nr:IQ domain-containing protein D [Seriola dumerili]XP_022607778.1 IQ domain-containing protein D [Seriola dumerili]